MSVKIRLAKFGKRHAPTYRIVVSHTKTKRNGKYLDMIGHYNPSDSTKDITLDKAKYEEWLAKGATSTDAVKALVAGNYEYIKYEPKKKGTESDSEIKADTNETSTAPEENVKETKEEVAKEETAKETPEESKEEPTETPVEEEAVEKAE